MARLVSLLTTAPQIYYLMELLVFYHPSEIQTSCVRGGQCGIDQAPSLGSLVCALHFSHSLSACLEGLAALLSFQKGINRSFVGLPQLPVQMYRVSELLTCPEQLSTISTLTRQKYSFSHVRLTNVLRENTHLCWGKGVFLFLPLFQ